MPQTFEFDLDCPKKKITVTWKVLVKGSASTDANMNRLVAAFERFFNAAGAGFKLGKCTVFFKLDVKREPGKKLAPGDSTGDRDVIVIETPQAGGGGFAYAEPGKRQLITIFPKPNGQFEEWKLINELGHGLGINDTGEGLEGEWNLEQGDPTTNRVLPRHIEEALSRRAPNAKKKAINDCCDAHLTVAKPGKIKIGFPGEPFEESNPRDDLYKYFPPGSDNPFTPEYERRLKKWQELVEKYGLTEAYRRYRKLFPFTPEDR